MRIVALCRRASSVSMRCHGSAGRSAPRCHGGAVYCLIFQRRGPDEDGSRAPHPRKAPMRRRDLTVLLGAAVAGILTGASTHAQEASPSPPPLPKHVCKGLNACKGQGVCKHGCSGHGCRGHNDCRGQGGCAALAAQHTCAGKNECKAIGGCATGDKGCAGKNTCKRRGGCEVPLKIEHTRLRKAGDPRK